MFAIIYIALPTLPHLYLVLLVSSLLLLLLHGAVALVGVGSALDVFLLYHTVRYLAYLPIYRTTVLPAYYNW